MRSSWREENCRKFEGGDMANVTEDRVQCPVCNEKSAVRTIDSKSSEGDLVCRACGFSAGTELISGQVGKQFWRETRDYPMAGEMVLREQSDNLRLFVDPSGSYLFDAETDNVIAELKPVGDP
jgi:transcription elongation factor Elf1